MSCKLSFTLKFLDPYFISQPKIPMNYLGVSGNFAFTNYQVRSSVPENQAVRKIRKLALKTKAPRAGQIRR